MPSPALVTWSADRATRLDTLEQAHLTVRGQAGRLSTVELTHALVLRLAREFQGYCRDLHDDCVARLVAGLALRNSSMEDIINAELVRSRRLDAGNASPAALGTGFSRLGLRLWPQLSQRYPSRGRRRNESLEIVHVARNGLAHDDAAKLAQLQVQGLAKAMDTVCRDYLRGLLGSAPW